MKFLNFILATFLMSLINHRVFIKGIDSKIQILMYVFVSVLYLLFNIRTSKKYIEIINSKILLFFSFLMLSIFSSALTPLLYGTNDFSYFARLLGILVYFIQYFALYIFIEKKSVKNNTIDNFFDVFVNSNLIYITVTFLFYVLPSMRTIWFNYVQFDEGYLEYVNTHTAYAFRIGWNGFAGFGVTFLCTFSILLVLIRFQNKNNNITDYLKISFLLLGNMFYGRVGILMSSILITIFIIRMVVLRGKIFNLLMFGIVFLLGFLFIMNLSESSRQLTVWIEWVTNPITNLLKEGSVGQNRMFEMYFLPETKTFFWGDGWYRNPIGTGYYMEVDVGYMRPLLFYGIFNTVLVYFNIVIMTFYSGKSIKNYFIIFILMTVFFFEVKGEVIFQIIPILLLLSLVISKGDNDEFNYRINANI